MASRYHWLQFGIDTAWPVGPSAFIHQADVTIPAGGIVKKIIFNNTIIQGVQSGSQKTGVGIFSLNRQVSITSGPYSPRVIFASVYRIPAMVTSILVGLVNEFTAWHCAGDRECGDELQCSYGKSSDVASWNVRITHSFVNYAPSYNTAMSQGRVAVGGRLLYYK